MLSLQSDASPIRKLGSVLRMWEWWEYKVTCYLGLAYAFAYHEGLPFAVLWPVGLMILLAAISCAGYVSILNEITDQAADARVGKSNSMAGRSILFKTSTLGGCLAVGLLTLWLMKAYPVSQIIFALNWIVFALYSVPPFRLKSRGTWGALADAAGERTLPALLMASLLAEANGHEMEWFLALPLIVWSLAFGLRHILEHQMEDRENDQRANIDTAATRYGDERLSRVVVWRVYPVEVAALLGLLAALNLPLAWPILVLSLVIETRRGRFARLIASWREPSPYLWVPLNEYYKVYLPATFLLALAWQEPVMLMVLVAHLVLFPKCNLQAAYAVAGLLLAPFRRGYAAWHAGEQGENASLAWNQPHGKNFGA